MTYIERQGIISYEWGRHPTAAAGCGDVDGDGWGDVVLGVEDDRHPATGQGTGGAYVHSGRDGSVLYRIHSPRPVPFGYFGHAVAPIQDLDGDGRPEIIIGAYFQERSAYVFSGADGSLLHDLLPSDGVRPHWFGISVSSIPDVDGDGFDDVLVGSTPHAYAFSGATGAELYRVSRPYPNTAPFADQVAGIPDLDGDGRGDILVVSIGESGANYEYMGRAFLFSGGDGSLIRWFDNPVNDGTGWGRFVAALPDIDGDGMGDFAICAPTYRDEAYPHANGTVFVYSGASAKIVGLMRAPLGPRNWFGYAVAVTPDWNGDGLPNLIVGNPLGSVPGYATDAGTAYVFSLATFQAVREYRSPSPYVPPFPSGNNGGQFGTQVAAVIPGPAGGRGDVFASAPGDCIDNCPPSRRGRAYIFLSCGADFNYDGVIDSRDFFDFIIAFFDGRGAADFDRDGRVTSGDFFAFIGAFFGGCEW